MNGKNPVGILPWKRELKHAQLGHKADEKNVHNYSKKINDYRISSYSFYPWIVAAVKIQFIW